MVSIGAGDPALNAEDTGIQLYFVPGRSTRDDAERATNAKLLDLPVLDHGQFNGSKG
jgi:hypothetical protein